MQNGRETERRLYDPGGKGCNRRVILCGRFLGCFSGPYGNGRYIRSGMNAKKLTFDTFRTAPDRNIELTVTGRRHHAVHPASFRERDIFINGLPAIANGRRSHTERTFSPSDQATSLARTKQGLILITPVSSTRLDVEVGHHRKIFCPGKSIIRGEIGDKIARHIHLYQRSLFFRTIHNDKDRTFAYGHLYDSILHGEHLLPSKIFLIFKSDPKNFPDRRIVEAKQVAVFPCPIACRTPKGIGQLSRIPVFIAIDTDILIAGRRFGIEHHAGKSRLHGLHIIPGRFILTVHRKESTAPIHT